MHPLIRFTTITLPLYHKRQIPTLSTQEKKPFVPSLSVIPRSVKYPPSGKLVWHDIPTWKRGTTASRQMYGHRSQKIYMGWDER